MVPPPSKPRDTGGSLRNNCGGETSQFYLIEPSKITGCTTGVVLFELFGRRLGVKVFKIRKAG